MRHDDIEQWLEQRRIRPPEGPAPTLFGIDHAVAALDAAVSRIRLAQPGDPPVPRGWLLHGRPGTGKSALTGRALRALGPDVAAYDLAVQWLTPERLSRALAYLADRKLAVVLTPELDSWGSDRSYSDPQSRRLLFAALEGLDSLGRQTDPTRGYVLIATTSRRSILDAALLRQGRFSVQISLPLPDVRDRRRILESVLVPWPTEALDLEVAAAQTVSWSPADLRGAVDQAVGRALSRGGRGTRVSQADVMDSIRVAGHLDREDDPEVVADRLRVAAAHEAGHVAVSVWFGRIPTAVTLRDTGDGFTQAGREGGIRDERELREMIVTLMGGIAAERLVIGAGSTGSSDDVAQATRIAVSLVEAGLERDFPPINRAALSERPPRAVEEGLADHVMELLAHARERAETIVGMQRDAVERLAQQLIETPMLAGASLRAAIEEAGFTVSTTSGGRTDPWISARS